LLLLVRFLKFYNFSLIMEDTYPISVGRFIGFGLEIGSIGLLANGSGIYQLVGVATYITGRIINDRVTSSIIKEETLRNKDISDVVG